MTLYLGPVFAGNALGQVRTDAARRLTFPEGGESNQNPCFSPDASFIVFTRFENGYNIGPAHLYRLALTDGSKPVQLTSGDFDDVNVPYGCFHRSANRVIFASDRDDANDFWTIDPNPDSSPDLQRITSHGKEPIWIEPVYSPAGDWIAFESTVDFETEESRRSAIFKINPATHEVVQLTNFEGHADDRLPSWSPDGSRILYQHRDPSAPDSLDAWEAWIVDTNGNNHTSISAKIITSQPGPYTDLSWMPDGRHILSSTNPNNTDHPGIYMLPVAGGSLLRVTHASENEDGAPCASPDGSVIAFESHRTSDEQSPSDIWIIPVPVSASPKVINPGGILELLLLEK